MVDHVLPAPIIVVASIVVERPGNSRSEKLEQQALKRFVVLEVRSDCKNIFILKSLVKFRMSSCAFPNRCRRICAMR